LVERAAQVGARLLDDLRPLAELPIVGEVRGVGLMLAVELARDTPDGPEIGARASRDLRDRHGLIVRAHESVLSLSPPLVITDDEVERVVGALQDTLTRIGEGLA
ncbi:MAG TPA: aminotransferase class III-fold pyridoxal phosphate-dependent enzyme, partial [Solirubrobacteraceae bacterium]|nr:aminotransferase class III-fold pyridoxal phosphate-dependent enzyme [Solirubrobacteraceae bacterium]